MKTITTTYNPETHKLVPVEPTPEMLCTLMQWDPETGFSILPEYRAMLAAVPEAPEQADNWQQYAKPGETAQQCIERHRAEQDALMTLLAQARAEQAAKAEGQEQRSEDEPVAWGFHNTALTGRNRWMMLREQVPENDQYGGAMWTPLYTTPQRRECARYNDRDNYNTGTPFARWLCGPFDNDHIIRHEETQPIQTTWRHS